MADLPHDARSMAERRDARVVRTRENLRAAALDLVARREWSDISITDLTRQAGISRPTFYLHYTSLDELAADALIGRIRESSAAAEELPALPDGVPGPLLAFLGEVNQHRVVYRRLVGARSVAGIAREMVAGHLAERLMHWGATGSGAEEFAQFLAGGILGFLAYWLRTDAVESKESVSAAALRLWGMIGTALVADYPPEQRLEASEDRRGR